MCTLITLWQCHTMAPLVLGLNRDEFLDRPTQHLHLWDDSSVCRDPDGARDRIQVAAGKDLRSGGTWFGVTGKVVAGLTNQRHGNPGRRWPRSRGEIVLRALAQDDLAAVHGALEALPMREYGPFHLLACDGEGLGWWTNRNGVLQRFGVEPGPHVLGNDGLDDPRDEVVARLMKELDEAQTLPDDELQASFRSLLARHGRGWPCVHLGAYGTRSSAILCRGGASDLLFATEGPPCTSPWQDKSGLLRELRGTADP